MLLLTLCFFRRDFGEERNLSHCNEGQAQDLQEHADDKLRQLIGEITCSTHTHTHTQDRENQTESKLRGGLTLHQLNN